MAGILLLNICFLHISGIFWFSTLLILTFLVFFRFSCFSVLCLFLLLDRGVLEGGGGGFILEDCWRSFLKEQDGADDGGGGRVGDEVA